jgi:hypothetical protein
MTDQTEHDEHEWSARARWTLLVFAIVGAFFLAAEHRAHIVPLLPWLLLAACPLMHLFMHGSHRGHGGHYGPDRGETDTRGGDVGPKGTRHRHEGGPS